jgi:hypothetical protein
MSTATINSSRKDALNNDLSLFTPVEFSYVYKLLLNENGDHFYKSILTEYEQQLQEKERRKIRSYVFEKEGEWMKGITNTAEGVTSEGKWSSSSQAHRVLVGMVRERAWLRQHLETNKKLYEEELTALKQKLAAKTNELSVCALQQTNPKHSYKSEKDRLEGLYENGELILEYHEDSENYPTSYEVYGSWNNWEKGYPLLYDTSLRCSFISFDVEDQQNLQMGKHQYKYKHEGEWIEPAEGTAVEKDSEGNVNAIVFIHQE